MPVSAVDDIFQVQIWCTLFGQKTISTLHYRVITAPTPTDVLVISDQLAGFVGNAPGGICEELEAIVSPNLSIDFVRAQRVYPTRQPYVDYGVYAFGTLTGDALPPGATLQIAKRTVIAAPGRTGHMAVSGVPIDKTVNGIFTSAFLTLCEPLEDALETSITLISSGYVLRAVVLHQSDPLLSEGILQCEAQQSVRTMRRRVVGRGI